MHHGSLMRQARVPDSSTFTVGEIVALAALSSCLPVPRGGDPSAPRKEARLGNKSASDSSLRVGFDPSTVTDAREALPELRKTCDTVRHAERVPCEPIGKDAEAREKAKASDRMMGCLELEEKRRSD